MAIPPITDETAKAVGKLADLGTTILTETSALTRYMARVLGTTPADLVGATVGAPLHAVHTLIAGVLNQKVEAYLERRKVQETQGVSPSLGLPLLRAAYDESRPELQDMWAALIAAAMDPARSNRVRLSFIETLKRFDPLDALIMKTLHDRQAEIPTPDTTSWLNGELHCSHDDVVLSFDNLRDLHCAICPPGSTAVGYFALTLYGTALVRACSD